MMRLSVFVNLCIESLLFLGAKRHLHLTDIFLSYLFCSFFGQLQEMKGLTQMLVASFYLYYSNRLFIFVVFLLNISCACFFALS